MKSIALSIITPCFNEELNVDECALVVRELMARELPGVTYEHIFCDNNSKDGTFLKLQSIAMTDRNVKVILNSANVGPLRNIYHALKFTSGNAVIPMLPADLQDPAELIPVMYRKFMEGNLVVYGIRKNRQESILMRSLRKLYYRVISMFASETIPNDSGEFLIADQKIIKSILKTEDQYPYIRGLIAQTQVKSDFVHYTWVRRKAGKSKANIFSLIDQAINGFISTSRVPARIAIFTGFLMSTSSFFIAIWSVFSHLFFGPDSTRGISTIIVIMSLIGGTQLLFLGIIGEYVLSIHAQVRRSPEVFAQQLINFNE